MYIGSTNLYLDIFKSNAKVPASWMTSEKYENCEGFSQLLAGKHNRLRLFQKKK